MTVTLDNPDALLLASEVAEYRRMTDNALRQERWRGSGPRYLRVNRKVLYRAGDLAEWLASQIVTPTPRSKQRPAQRD